jgi:hypothetical protein
MSVDLRRISRALIGCHFSRIGHPRMSTVKAEQAGAEKRGLIGIDERLEQIISFFPRQACALFSSLSPGRSKVG